MRNATKAGFLFASALFFAAPLAAQFSGTWKGTFEERWLCDEGKHNFTSTGTMSMTLTQFAGTITGSATINTPIDECVPDPKTFTVRVTFGRVTNATEFKAYFGFPRSSGSQFVATLSGGTLGIKLLNPDPKEYFFNAKLRK